MRETAVEAAASELEALGFTRAGDVDGPGFGDHIIVLTRGTVAVRAVRDRGEWRAERRLFGRWVSYSSARGRAPRGGARDPVGGSEQAALDLKRLGSLDVVQMLSLAARRRFT